MYNRSLLYVLICFCIDHQKHIIYFPFYFFPRHFFFTFFLFFCLFFSIIFISCNFTKHTPWQYLRLTAMDDQTKAIHAYLQICFMIYPFFSLFYFYFLFLSRRYNFLLLYFSFSLSLSLILLSWILTTRILHLVALSTHVCIKIYYYNEANVWLAFYFFVVTYLYIFVRS